MSSLLPDLGLVLRGTVSAIVAIADVVYGAGHEVGMADIVEGLESANKVKAE